MVLNIPVPITDLERIGTLDLDNLLINESNNVTTNISWSGILSRITVLPDALIFGFGSVELPSICFIDSFSGFYAPQLGSVAISTGHTEKFAIRSSGLVEFGDPLLKEKSRTTIESKSTIKCQSRFLENVEIQKTLTLQADIQLNSDTTFEDVNINGEGDGGNLSIFGDYVKFGQNCFQTFKVYNNSRSYCEVVSKENIEIKVDLNNHLSEYETTVTTQTLNVNRKSELNLVKTFDNVIVDDGGRIEFLKEGNVTVSGNVNVSGIISGDGQDITNLNLPASLRLKGSIDPTTEGPGTPQHGDVWYSTASGNFTNDWVGLEGQAVTIGRSFYYFATPTPKWILGGISDLQSPYFMMIDLDQTVTGNKTHADLLVAENTIDTGLSGIEANKLALTSKGTSALTVAGDNGKTITTKSYVDARMTNATLDFNLKPSKYIIGQKYDGSLPQTWDMDASPVGSDNLVKRNDDGNFNANIITATFLDGITIDAKTLDIFQSDSDTDHPITLVRSTGLSRLVYSDNDFTYNPVSDTLSVDYVIGDVTGDVTGNVSTFTKFETTRTLWGQSFDATSDVSGDLIDVGSITSQETDTKDIGTADNVWSNVYATDFHGTLLGSVTVGDSTRQTIVDGNHILGGPWNGSDPITWYVDCSSTTVSNKIVVRDSLGNFSSNKITANEFVGPLTGNVTGNATGSSSSVTGNTDTATKFETPRDLWSQFFDGTSNVDGSIFRVNDIVPSEGSTFDIGSESLPFSTVYVDVIDGDVDNNTTSTDKVNNALGRGEYIEGVINQWDGSIEDTWSIDPRSGNDPSRIVNRDVDGDFSSGTITASFVGDILGDVTGNASGSSSFVTGNTATATKFETLRRLWSQSFEGTQNVSSQINFTGNIVPSENDKFTLGREDLKFQDVYAETFHGYFQDNVDNVDFVVSNLSTGNYITGDPWNGSEDLFWNVFSRSNNITGSVVNRDSTGSFTASTITSDFIGSVTGDATGDATGSSESVTGNAATCTRLEIERKIDITFQGVISGSGTFGYLGGDLMVIVAPVEVELDEVSISNLQPLPE